MTADQIIEGIVGREGRYANNPKDRGGETMWGVTIATARAYGYQGAMRELPRSLAKQIYLRMYYTDPKFDRIAVFSERVAEELTDTGVNMGPVIPTQMLQRALNALNREGKLFKDMAVDGFIGPTTLSALDAFLDARGKEGEEVLLKALNCLQGCRYIDITEGRPANEEFTYGWLKERVAL